jgi:environmental stress-induced protein Ves
MSDTHPAPEQAAPIIVRADEIEPVPWRNGGGVTRELLAWPDARDWTVRVSVADITASGPFSEFPGVERWFAVLAGGAVRLATAGMAARQLDASQAALHQFAGDSPTYCTPLGPATRDCNIMLRRARGRLEQRPLAQCAELESRADAVGLFAADPASVAQGGGEPWLLPAVTLAWWNNPRRATLRLRIAAPARRGWWIEVATHAAPPR